MKKFILKAIPVFGIAFLFASGARAQSTMNIRDFYNGNVVTNDTVYFWVNIGQAHQYLFNQTNISAGTVTYKVIKANVQLVSGALSNFCIYHNNDAGDPQSQCYIPSVTQSGNFITDPGEFNTLLADFGPGNTPGVSIVKYKFYDIANPNDSTQLVLVYNATPVGIAESFVGGSLGEPYPNPANGAVAVPYELGNSGSVHLVVTDAVGRMVHNEMLTFTSGTAYLNTESWADGIYFITLVSDGEAFARKKMMVQ